MDPDQWYSLAGWNPDDERNPQGDANGSAGEPASGVGGRTSNNKTGSHTSGQQENIFNGTSNSATQQVDASLGELHAVPPVTKAEALDQ